MFYLDLVRCLGQNAGISGRADHTSARTIKGLRSRREFIQSISRTAAVFTFDQLIRAAPAPLPVQFVNVAREAGLNRKTIFGGTSATLICSKQPAAAPPSSTTTTTAGSTFSWSTARASKRIMRPAKRPSAACTRTIATAHSPMSPSRPGLARTGWGQGVLRRRLRQRRLGRSVRHLLGRVRRSIAIMATARSPMSRKRPA